MTLLKTGRGIFAIGMAALGSFCIVFHDFIIGRPPKWAEHLNDNIAFGLICGSIIILASLAILIGRQGGIAALIMAVLMLVFSVFRHLPVFINDWVNGFKAIALLGGALIAAGSFLHEEKKLLNYRVNDGTIEKMILVGTILLASFFIAGGYAHFKWANGVQFLIPEFIPFRLFWTYFCGVCLFAGGIGILIPPTRKLAALLSGIMVLGWFLLLHIPRFVANPADPSDQLGLFESFTFAGEFFILAALFRKPDSKA
jgi:uncharacterized membrane protein YphA (DoxX/SURF4 family)